MYGADRGAFHGNLTASEAEEFLAIPVFLVLSGQASLNFVGSTASTPARYVEIAVNGTCSARPQGIRPVRVNLTQYRRAILPVLLDEKNWTQRSINLRDIAEGDPIRKRYLETLGSRLRQAFEAAGY